MSTATLLESSLDISLTVPSKTESKPLSWDATSRDYLQYRPGYPPEFFSLLQRLGVGLPGQDILDLGAGTGALSIPFALRKARVTATDISSGQIEAAREDARLKGVNITFKVAPSEETGLPDHAFDVISASMCWGYFDLHRMLAEVPRLLRRPGKLLLSSLVWIRGEDPVAKHSEALVLKYNPSAARSFNRKDESFPEWSKDHFRLKTYHSFTAHLPFTRESWRGRLRASKFILAALPADQALAFDREHAALLQDVAPDRFEIAHNIRLHIFEPK
jgi:2-polyprenyl-3-methyl-5-hydroxy-6-metoxy-1,4-benzoquinol methylase